MFLCNKNPFFFFIPTHNWWSRQCKNFLRSCPKTSYKAGQPVAGVYLTRVLTKGKVSVLLWLMQFFKTSPNNMFYITAYPLEGNGCFKGTSWDQSHYVPPRRLTCLLEIQNAANTPREFHGESFWEQGCWVLLQSQNEMKFSFFTRGLCWLLRQTVDHLSPLGIAMCSHGYWKPYFVICSFRCFIFLLKKSETGLNIFVFCWHLSPLLSSLGEVGGLMFPCGAGWSGGCCQGAAHTPQHWVVCVRGCLLGHLGLSARGLCSDCEALLGSAGEVGSSES